MVDVSKPKPEGNFDVGWWLHAGATAFKHFASAAAVMAILFTIARPHAEEFIADTVDERIGRLERQMSDVQTSVDQQQRQQAIIQNDVEHIKKGQEDTKINTRMILNAIQGMRREQ